MLSCANVVMTDGNTLLKDDELEMLVLLRINRAFMREMRANYPKVCYQTFGQTVVDHNKQ
eukprot:6176609-Pleurochrysis_carterae.AAC.1